MLHIIGETQISFVKRIVAAVTSAALIFATFFWCFEGVYSYASDESSSYSEIMSDDVPADYDASDMSNPYSNNDNKFVISSDRELLTYRSYDDDETAVSVHDKYEFGSMDIGDGTTSYDAGWSSHTENTGDINALNYQRCIAFDPDGSGYDNHVAYIGFEDGGIVCIWVYDSSDGSCSEIYRMGNCNWYDFSYHGSRRFVTITSGDYDDDGKDTFVVYMPGRNNTYRLYEFAYADGEIIEIGNSQQLLHPEYAAHSELINSNAVNDKLGCNLTTGDFDGDGIDDLGVISFTQNLRSEYSSYELLTPYFSAAYGDSDLSGGSVLQSKNVQGTYVYINSDTEKISGSDYDTYQSMRSPSISAGDVDGDGLDEIVAGGFYCKTKDNGTSASFVEEMDFDRITLSVINTDRESVSVGGPERTVYVNGWTDGTDLHESYTNQLCVQCVAFDGQSSAESVFVSGSVYTVDGNDFKLKYIPEYFQSTDDWIGINETRSCSMEAIAGVFDGNDKGREQLMITYCSNLCDYSDKYYFGVASIYGTEYDEDNVSGAYGSHTEGWVAEGITGNNMSFCTAAVDADEDSIVGTYTGKSYTYADPKVEAVLQAGPYFGTVNDDGGYAGGCSTSYSVITEFETGETSGNRVAFGAGVTASAETTLGIAMSTDIRAGYTLTWLETFKDSVYQEYATTWTAGAEDQVIISRVPVTVYEYNVQHKNDDTDSIETIDEALSISVPGKPVYYQLDIDEYNEFVEEYNTRTQESIDEFNSEQSSDEDKVEFTGALKKINRSNSGNDIDMPDDTAGNPENYWNSWTESGNGISLSQTPRTLGYNGGQQTSSYEEDQLHSESAETSHGFSFSSTFKSGAGLFGSSVKAGVYVSLDYLHITGSYLTTASGTETSGTVANINSSALEDAGYTSQMIRNYGFTWEFGIWNRCLIESDPSSSVENETTPFYGYIVYDVKQPPAAPKNVVAEKSSTDSIHEIDLSWDETESAFGYNIYVLENGEYVKLNDEPVTGNSYSAAGLDSNTEYRFAVTAVGYIETSEAETGESTYGISNICKTAKDTFTLEITADKGAEVDAVSGGISIENGGSVLEGDPVMISAAALDGYSITSIVLKRDGQDDKEILSSDGKFNFVMDSDAEVVVKAKKIVEKSIISYDVNDENTGDVKASASGQEFESGASVYVDSVIFKAEPEEGYTLQKWVIETEGEDTIEVDANGELSYEFRPFAKAHNVTAVFTDSDDESVNAVIDIENCEGGRIILSGTDGNELSLDEDGMYHVSIGSEVTFKAVPDNHYVLSSWTGRLGFLDESSTEYTCKIYEDMKAGASFIAPFKYIASYGVNDDELGTVSSNLKNGEDYVADTKMSIKATAANDKVRLYSWTVQSGNEEETVDVDEYSESLEYSYDTVIKKVTRITANFKEREEYILSLSDTEGAVYDVTDQNGNRIESGDKVLYGDELTICCSAGNGYVLASLEVNGEKISSGDKVTVKSGLDVQAQCRIDLKEIDTDSAVYSNRLEADISGTSFKYTGKKICPEVSVKIVNSEGSEKVLAKDRDYKVTYKNNVEVGTATVTIEGINGYTGKITRTFKIKDNTTLYYNRINSSLSAKISDGKFITTWGAVGGADGYEVYASKCSDKFSSRPVKTVKGTKASLTKISGNKISSKSTYKVKIRAYRMDGKEKVYLATSYSMHVAGSGYKYTNPKKITSVPETVTLKAGKTKNISAGVTGVNVSKKLLPTTHCAKLRYRSTDKTVAAVSSTGKIKGVSKGTCKIYVIAANGLTKKISVTVK